MVAMIYSIDDSVRSNDKFAQRFVAEFRDHSAALRKLIQAHRLLNQERDKPKCLLTIIGRDVTNDFV
jgi:hypothetical protein